MDIAMNEEHKAFIEARAQVYWWFATVLSEELSDEQLAVYQGEAGQAFLTTLASTLDDEGMAALAQLQGALTSLTSFEHPRLELAVEFTESFLRGDECSAMPYASIYLSDSGLLYQKPHDEMRRILEKQGLSVSADFREPADHIGIMLDYLGNLVIQALDTPQDRLTQLYRDQHLFIEQRLLSWVPQFVQRCQALPGTGFYPAVTRLLLLFLQQECAECKVQGY